MSFLKKVFLLQKSQKKSTEVDRAVRVPIDPLFRITFNRVFNDGGVSEKLGNISKSGMGILLSPENQNLKPEEHICGTLSIEQNIFELEAKVRHLTGQILGCQFMGKYQHISDAIQEYLKAEILALSLEPIKASSLAHHPDGEPFWFTDGGNNELYFVMAKNKIIEFHMTFLGSYLEGGDTKKLKFGHIVDEVEKDQASYKGSNLIQFQRELPIGIEEIAEKIIKRVKFMTENERLQLLKLISVNRPLF